MPQTPTYDELKQRIKDLEQESFKRSQSEQALKSERDILRTLIDGLASVNIGVDIVTTDFEVLQQNQTLIDRFGDNADRKCYQQYMALNKPCDFCPMIKSSENKRLERAELRAADGKDYEIFAAPLINSDGTADKVIEVIQDITERKQAEQALRQSEGKLNAMLQSIADHMSLLDKDLNIIWANKIANKIFGNDIVGKKCYEVYHNRKEPCEPYPCITLKAFQDGKVHMHETQVIDQKGATIHFHCTANVALRDTEGKPTAVIEISRDITKNKQTEQALSKAHKELERRVKERTEEIEAKTKSLEEINTAMEVLLKKRNADKIEIEDNVMTNLRKLITPYFEKIKKTKLDNQQEVLLNILESNLNEIISPFTRRLSLKHINLTPKEMEIANLITNGNTTKDIANFMNISPRTVDTHRKNIRKKIGLEKKGANLRSYLLSFQ